MNVYVIGSLMNLRATGLPAKRDKSLQVFLIENFNL